MSTRANTDEHSFWDFWKRPRIVEVDASERTERQIAPGCCERWTGAETSSSPSDRRGIALSARWKGTSIGGATLDIHDDTAVIRTLQVDPSWSKKGIARRLLRALLRRIRFQFAREVYVLATAAQASFYALHGFRPVDEREDSHGLSDRLVSTVLGECVSNGLDVAIMRRRLTPGFMSVPYDGITVKM